MALSHLVKHIYNNATDEVIRRGKKIHALGFVEMMDHNALINSISFRVKDDMYNIWYKVFIQHYSDPKGMELRCTCPYNLSDVCRHKAAALLQLQDMVDRNALEGQEINYNQKHTQIKIKGIDLKMIKMLGGQTNYEDAEQLLTTNKAKILSAKEEKVEAELVIENEIFQLVIRKNDERFFDTSCTCDYKSHPLCKHKVLLFLQLSGISGANYFDSIRNYDRDKDKLLSLYGYSLTNDLKGKFEFTYKDGRPFLRVLDTSIKRVTAPTTAAPKPVFVETKNIQAPVIEIEEPTKKLGVVFNANFSTYPFFSVDAVQGDKTEDKTGFSGKVEKIDLSKYVNTEVFDEEDKQLLQQLRKFSDAEVNKYLNRNSPFSGIWENIVHTNGDELPEETRHLINEYLHPKLKRLLEEKQDSPFMFLLPAKKKFITGQLQKVNLSTAVVKPSFFIKPVGDAFEMKCKIKIDDEILDANENEWNTPLLFLHDNTLYAWDRSEDILLAEKHLQKGTVLIDAKRWPSYAEKNIAKLAADYDVEFDQSLVQHIKEETPEIKLQLQEKGDYLAFVPVFSYKGFIAPNNNLETITIPHEGKVLMVHRQRDKENDFLQQLTNLHTQFIRPEGSMQLILKGTDVLKDNWFFLFVETMKERKISLLGFDALRNFKFNTARPTTHIRISSGVDWFDAKVDISFGDQKVRISDIKKALANKQTLVPLPDGTLGILPEEWVQKYSLLFKVGEGNNDTMKLSKFHFSVIDELYEQRDSEELMMELEERFDRLREFKKITKVDAPAHLDPILRPYQLTGFHWLNFLQETGCGGILADDMGLGKTIQALTMLQHYKEDRGALKAIVVCPTTLLYNWENEIKKFTSSLTYFIHHGPQRSRDDKILGQYDIIITTYGTLRSDIVTLQKIPLDYIVLDESQAIKNPNSKVAKAACLLGSKNRVCMSGTPLQNNTFDIFAQMNFLNPGLLGSMDFFRNEFATPIDKFGEKVQKEHLRKLLFPFILRRTKEQVAKDLPEKTETILFCEMEKEQRNIYDAYRNDYRDKIMGVINVQGIDRSQLTILQGLMKLRQICDSPAILNEQDKYPNVSIKLDELTREITENISDHKALVFSQFLGMLGLIKEKLKEAGVQYEYFDGSTTVQERQRAIDNFQNNPDCRVFLISLKAGGVGLNLTAADYVYIVDPWWNPAVEQQAIDRTHRIGQTKNIFAYRMICKDTIEDKIIQLQERKRALARELIGDDAGFVKKLTKEDVEYLFS